jgi:hypothetical protein
VNRIGIRVLPLEQLEELWGLIGSSKHKPYRFLRKSESVNLDGFWMGQLVDDARKQNSHVLSAVEDGKFVGMVVYADLPWETKVFGKRIGSLKYVAVNPSSPHSQEIIDLLLNEIIQWATSCGIEFLLCKAYTDDTMSIHALERKGFLLMDTQLDYVFDYGQAQLKNIQRPPLPEGFMVRRADIRDTEQLANVARAAFGEHFGRFHSDV